MSKGFWGIIVAIVLVFVGVAVISNNKSDKTTSSSKSSSLTNNVIGNPNSGVTLVEYGDFECPYCQQYEPTVSSIVSQYKDRIQFQFRNFPLVSLHRNAFAAARAAEAAALQGKFWEMHDALYNQSNWQVWTTASNPNPYFEQYAAAIGLNAAQFKKDFASSKVNDAINADMAEGNKLGITGTPTFFVNGKKTDFSNDPASFQKVLDAAIAAKSSSAN